VLRVIGANGAGKSTLLKVLRGDLWHTGGSRTYFFTDPTRESPIGARERIALVTPELQDRLRRLEYDRIALELVQTGFAQTDYLYAPLTAAQLERSQTVMRDLKLEGLMDRPVNQLSQGQLRQTLLARAVVGNPDILLLDEFFAGIDPGSRTRLRELVDSLARNGLTIVYTTHRETETLETTTRHVTLEAGQVVGQPRARGQRAVGAAPSRTSLRVVGETLIEVSNANVFLGDPRDDATAADGHASSAINHVLHEISLEITRGQHVALLGANGAGKTTLSRVLRGEIAPALGGTVQWFGQAHTPLWERQQRIGLVSSDTDARHRVEATGFTVVASGYSGGVGWHAALEDSQTQRVYDLLEALGISSLEPRDVRFVSQGELRKLLIARSLVTQPDVLILDEAFDYLDATSREALFDTLEELASQTTFVVISHRRDEVPDWVRYGVRLEAGRVTWSGALADLE
jgi:molybdate transport system ATP-binding protein